MQQLVGTLSEKEGGSTKEGEPRGNLHLLRPHTLGEVDLLKIGGCYDDLGRLSLKGPQESESYGVSTGEEIKRLRKIRAIWEGVMLSKDGYYDDFGLTIPDRMVDAFHDAGERELAAREPQPEAEIIPLPVIDQPQEAA
ncbi:MAG TPA: hypothetical protein VD947_00380 [Patescibacteria group bacterium]|nr:hypothetical protein [Patescibacteria group bacterium]